MRSFLRGVTIRLLVRLLDRTAPVRGSLGHNDTVVALRFIWSSRPASPVPLAGLAVDVAGRRLDIILSPRQLATLVSYGMDALDSLQSSYDYTQAPDFDVRSARIRAERTD
jgi:hypothetical protein